MALFPLLLIKYYVHLQTEAWGREGRDFIFYNMAASEMLLPTLTAGNLRKHKEQAVSMPLWNLVTMSNSQGRETAEKVIWIKCS